MPTTDPLAAAQDDLYVRLATRKQLVSAGVMIQCVRPRTAGDATAIMDGINKALLGNVGDRGRAGLAVLIPLPGFSVRNANVPSVIGQITLSVVVMENIAVNEGPEGTRMTCELAAALIMLAGHHFQFGAGRSLVCEGMTPLNVEDQEFSADVAYEIRFTAQEGFQQEAACAMPLITVNGGVTTITCATSNTRILMTLDGSMPWDGNANATPVTEAFETPEPGTVIRVVAYHEDLNPSSAAWLVTP